MGTSLKNQYWRFLSENNEISVSVTGRYAVDNMQLIVKAAQNGMGIAQVPYPLVIESLENGKLIRLFAEYSVPEQSMYIIYPSHKHLAQNVRVFIDYVITSTQPLAPWVARQ